MCLCKTWMFCTKFCCRFSKRGKVSFSIYFSVHVCINIYICRQINMDYSICNAARFNSSGLCRLLIIYDIVCQWCINFLHRLHNSQYLDFGHWSDSNVLYAIGKFHLNAHKNDCFSTHSLNFIRGIGQADGEIMETNWHPANKIFSFARTMTPSHRAETYDNFMRDTNWKKLVGMGESCIFFGLFS
jgi:hypothetical protein